MTTRHRDSGSVDFGELPEFARALRAMGSARHSGGERQSGFFFALIEARRRAADATDPEGRVRAFDAAELGRALDRAIDRLVSEWPDKRASARRAFRAELGHRVEPYAAALRTLSACGAEFASAGTDSRLEAWQAWTTQLGTVFVAADRAWLSLTALVDSLPAEPRREASKE